MYTRCDSAAFANFVAAISRTNSNWFELVRLIAATKFWCSDNDFHEIHRVTQGDLLQRLVPATCRSDLSPSVSQPLCHVDVSTIRAALERSPEIMVFDNFEGIEDRRLNLLEFQEDGKLRRPTLLTES